MLSVHGLPSSQSTFVEQRVHGNDSPAHAPSPHRSLRVHGSPSLHAAVLETEPHLPFASQVSSVHGLLSSHCAFDVQHDAWDNTIAQVKLVQMCSVHGRPSSQSASVAHSWIGDCSAGR